jgi:arylsulfatase A-like enzyme
MNKRRVLFISADQWRAECLSALGHPCVRTPHLDRLASRGVLFKKHYASCSPCGPSRTSMHTGQYLMNHRSGRNGTPLDVRHTNLALEARKGGFDPVLFGYTDTSVDPREYPANDPALKTYEGVLPGFTVGLQLPDHMAAWVADLKEKGYDLPNGRQDVYRPVANYPGAEHRGHTFAPTIFGADDSETTFMANAALRHLSVREDQDWFMHLVFLRPHPPIIAPEPYNAMYDPADSPLPIRAETPEREATQHPYLQYLLHHQREIGWYSEHYPSDLREIDEREIRQIRATYYGMITQVDDQIGRITAHLEKTREINDTLIIFTCDHGEMLGDHWMWGKEGYFDRAYHIPFILFDPRPTADATRGTMVDAFTEAVDIMPTILEWLDLPVPPSCDGRSLLPFLESGTPGDWRRCVHWEFDFRDVTGQEPEKAFGLTSDQCCLAVLRDDRHKYIHFAALPPLLFDLEKDPAELRSVAVDPAYAAIRGEMAERMLSWRMQHAERVLANTMLTDAGPVKLQPPRVAT